MCEPQNKPGTDCVEVALDIPMRQTFSYLSGSESIEIGMRVRVPFGRRQMIGVVTGHGNHSSGGYKLKPIESVLDQQPIFSKSLIRLIDWIARYYHHPEGEVWRAAMPKILRQGLPLDHGIAEPYYRLEENSRDWAEETKRAPVQQKIIRCLVKHDRNISVRVLRKEVPNARGAVTALLKKHCLSEYSRLPEKLESQPKVSPKVLSEEQQQALNTLSLDSKTFSCRVLEGITGSGKTEIYFSLIDQALASGLQSMVMVPEIALTDQLLNRFVARFGERVVHVHSAMNDAQRHRHWWMLAKGKADIVLCTRSGVFLEFNKLGLIVIDEEHDSSFKQHEGLRYHARSVAIKRAQIENIPIILGSATPALESVYNIEQGRFPVARLGNRIGRSQLPDIGMIDLNQQRADAGLSPAAIEALQQTLDQKQQALVFINRRGYAPVLYCPACQWMAQCKRCDAQMTTHTGHHSLQCHHCGAIQSLPQLCESCGEAGLVELGEGTQKIEEQLNASFPHACIQRFDRDNLNTANKLKQAMARVHSGEIDILVGTQLLSKGHDFAGVSLVLVINADQGLHSIDFRAPELMVQQLIQVAGRAGRGEKKGRVLIQTHFPDHPYLLAVQQHDYRQFAHQELQQRSLAGFPPYRFMALWRARSQDADFVINFLKMVAQIGTDIKLQNVQCFDPVPSPMFRRGGQYHAQLLVSADKRSNLHRWLESWIFEVEQRRESRRLHWSIDIDPISLF